jgi:hypothetical protein
VPICSADYSQAPPAPAPVTPTIKAPKGPRLVLRVRHRHHRRQALLLVAGQCHSGCKLTVSLLAKKPPKGDYRTRVSTRITRFSSRRQVVKLRVPRRLAKRVKHGRIVVVAVGRNGGTTTASRRVRLR